MAKKKGSETTTEGIFREFYGATKFIEKSAIPKEYGFKSKKKDSDEEGYPDFFYETDRYAIVVEAKPKLKDFPKACNEAKWYATVNKLEKDIFAISIAGQTKEEYKASLYYVIDGCKIKEVETDHKLLTLDAIGRIYKKIKYSDKISDESLKKKLKEYNEKFNKYKIQDTKRSLFFSGLMIALMDNTFIATYRNIQKPNEGQQQASKNKLIQAHNLNERILDAIVNQIETKVNSYSKEYHWRDQFSFIRNIDIPLKEYIKLIEDLEKYIFIPFREDEKHDILSRAYKIFLSRAGKVENKNIILTPDHIKTLMIELANLNVDDKVLDTCTGSGAFLMEALEKLVALAKNNDEKLNEIINEQLIGLEIDETLFALACSNMFLHHDGRSKLIFGSSLPDDNNSDVIEYIKTLSPQKCIINPPYENNQPIEFVKQAIDYLQSNGKLIVIMPTPTLNRNRSITEELMEKATLDYVIKMPERLFSEQDRSVNTSIFGFTKSKHLPGKKVIFYNMLDDGLVSVQHKGRVDKYGRWENIKKKLIDRIINNNEEPGSYELRKICLNNIWNFYGYKENKEGNNLVKFGDLFDTATKGSLASEDAIPGEYAFITASEEWKTHITFDYNKEAIVYAVAASGSLGRCHYVKGKFIASNLCLVLTPKNPDEYPVNLLFYSLYLNAIRQTIRNDIADGTSKLTLATGDLDEYLIEYIPKTKQDEIAKLYSRSVLKKKKQLEKAENDFNEKLICL